MVFKCSHRPTKGSCRQKWCLVNDQSVVRPSANGDCAHRDSDRGFCMFPAGGRRSTPAPRTEAKLAELRWYRAPGIAMLTPPVASSWPARWNWRPARLRWERWRPSGGIPASAGSGGSMMADGAAQPLPGEARRGSPVLRAVRCRRAAARRCRHGQGVAGMPGTRSKTAPAWPTGGAGGEAVEAAGSATGLVSLRRSRICRSPRRGTTKPAATSTITLHNGSDGGADHRNLRRPDHAARARSQRHGRASDGHAAGGGVTVRDRQPDRRFLVPPVLGRTSS